MPQQMLKKENSNTPLNVELTVRKQFSAAPWVSNGIQMEQVYTKLNTNIRHALGKSESLVKAQLQPQVLTTLTLMCLLKK